MTGRRKATPTEAPEAGVGARLLDDGVGLVISRPAPARMVEHGAGLLLTPAEALTAAATPADGDEPARHPDPWEEQRLDAAADLARWEHRLEAGARKALSAWTAVVATAVLDDQYLLAAPDGGLPPDPGAIPALASTWQRIANTHIVRLVSDLLGEVFARFLSDEQTVSARPWQDNYLENVANRLVSVADSTFDVVRRVVQDGIAEGASIPELRDAVQESLDAGGETSWAHRARTIARTETIGAYNGGHLAAWQAVEELTEEPTDKVWLATIDPRTRDTHFAADGQRRRLGVPFNVGLALLEHPGDPTGPAGEVINCRCTMLELDPDEETPDVAERGFRDPAEVQAEIARRAGLDPAVIRAFEDPDAPAPVPGLLAAAKPAELVRPAEDVVARMDAIFRASYTDPDPLLVDEGVVDPALVAAILGDVVTAASVGAIFGGDHYDPNQRRDENGKWTKRGVGISITVAGGDDVEASFAEPTEALARVTFEHELTGSDGKTYRSRVVKVDKRNGLMDVRVRIEDDQGRSVGKAERTVRQIPGGPQMYHDTLMINKGAQGLGLASEFNQRAEAVYRAAGITHVATHAFSSPGTGMVGGYVWARRGFGWADEAGPSGAANLLEALFKKGQVDPKTADVIARLRTGDLASRPTPFEVSELTSGSSTLGSGQIGRYVLLKHSWDGVRWLPEQEPSPAQDRVEDKAAAVVPAAPTPVAVTVDGAHDAKATAKVAEQEPAAEPVRGAWADADLADLAAASGPVSGSERQSLEHYRAYGYQAINAHLRGQTYTDFGDRVDPSPADRQAVTDLTAMADRNKLSWPVEVWRGMTGVSGILPPRGQVAGTVLTDPAFMSTSTDRSIAQRFTVGDPDADSALLRITVPEGHPALPMDGLAGVDADVDETLERELVLPPGSSLRIVGEEDDGGQRILVAEVLSYGGPEAQAAAAKAAPVVVPDPAPAPAAPTPLTGDDALAAASASVPARLKGDEYKAIAAYAGIGYGEINRHLRGTGTISPDFVDQRLGEIATLRAIAEQHPLPQPVRVYRGMQGADRLLPEGVSVGAVVTDPGFMSTSTEDGVAISFAGARKDEAAILELTAPAGHPVLPTDALLRGPFEHGDSPNGEWELAFPPGTGFRVTGDRRDEKGRRVVTGEMLPYGTAEPTTAPVSREPLTVDELDALDWFVSSDYYGPNPPPEAGVVNRLAARGLIEPIPGGPSWKHHLTPRGHEALDTGTAPPEPDADPLAEPHEIAAAEDAAAPPAPLAGDDAYRAAQSALSRDLSTGERRALESYTGSGADAMNAHLRGVGTDPKQQALVEDLTALAVASPLPEPVRVYRGIHHASAVLSGDDLTGATITDRAFVSTTTDVGVADLYAQDTYGSGAGPDDAVILDITVPAGHPSVPVDQALAGHGKAPGSSYLAFQKEVILPPGSSFRVTGDSRNADGVRVLTAEALPYSPPAPAAEPDAPAADAPAADAPAPAAVAAADLPPIKLTAARAQALDFYAAAPADRKGKGPNYSVYMPLLKAGLLERTDGGKYVLSDAGRAAHAGLPDTKGLPAEPVASAPDLTPAAPAVAAPAASAALAGPDAYATLPQATNPGQVAALAKYQGSGYAKVNQRLRGGVDVPGSDEEAAALREDLDAVLAAHTLDQPITVHRGSGSATAILGSEPLQPGSTITDPGYLSTTTDPEVANKFLLFMADPLVFQIDVPAGSHAVAVTGQEGHEAEALLPRSTPLRVVSDTVERRVVNPAAYRTLQKRAANDGDWSPEDVEAEARRMRIVVDVRTVRAEVVPADAPAAAAPDAPDLGDEVAAAREAATAARAAEVAAATAKAEKKAAAAAKRAEKKRAKEEAARAKEMADGVDAAGVPRTLTYEYLSGLSEEEREDVEVHLINGVAAGDPLDEQRLEDLVLFNEGQAVEDELGAQEDQLGTAGVDREIARWQEAHGRPGLTHPAVGGPAGDDGYNPLAPPSFKDVQQEYSDFLHEQLVKAENATNGYLVTARGRRLGRTAMDMFSGKRGVADVMQYATPELLEWFEQPENRRIAWAEFYYERTKAPGFAERAAKARAVSLQINRDRTALKADAALLELLAELSPPVLVAAPRLPAKVTEPSLEQLGAYLDGRATFATGAPVTDCPFPADDEDGLFVLWIRGWVRAQTAATRARVAGEGLWVDPDAARLSWTEDGGLLITPPLPPGPLDRFVAGPADLTVDLPTDAAASGDTVTAAGSGPGAPSATEGRRMPRTWKSAPHLAPFDTPTGDGRIFKVGSLTARELPLPLLFQPASGMGHDGSVVVGRILAVNFTDAGIEASGDYLDADSSTAPDLAKAVEQAVALTESGLGHVSVDLSDVVGELVDEDGNPVTMEDIFDAWDRGEDPKVLEQVAEGKLIACTQVATPAFEGAKIELSADAAPLPVDGEAALEDSAGEAIAVGAVVDAETDEGSIRGRVTAVDEDAESVTVQPTDADGADAGDVIEVAPAAITVVEPAPATDEAPDGGDQAAKEASLIAAAGPLRPPAAWFEDPKLEGPTAMTITDDGRVFGHVAVWGECHVGFSNTCVSPPTSPSGYKHFHVGEVVTEDGTRVAVGNLTLGGRHADVRLAYRSAIEHYDVSGAGTAVVRSGEDEYGIWFAGALTPGVTEEQIYDMRRSPVSGDWRRVGGELEMIGVLSVNSGGFNTPRFATDSAGRTALTAAPSVRPATSAKQTPSSLAQLTQRITADVTSAVRAQLVAERASEERAARLRGLAAAVRPDQTRQRKLASLSAKVDQPRRNRLAELSATVTR